MKPIVALLAPALLSIPAANAQSIGTWAAVEAIAPSSTISVVAEHTFKCSFDYATNSELACTPRGSSNSLIFTRIGVREVRVKHAHRGTILGAAIGVGAGVGIGASTGGSGALTRPATAVLLGGALGALGGYIGRNFSFSKGEVVYRR